jgi:hypothetical protein
MHHGVEGRDVMRKHPLQSIERLRVALLSSILIVGLDAAAPAAEATSSYAPCVGDETGYGVTAGSQSAAPSEAASSSSPDEGSVRYVKSQDGGDSSGIEPKETIDKRIFGVIPNYRTSPSLKDYEPLTTNEKFRIASQDVFDRGTLVLAAVFAGDAQITHADPSFGQGVNGFGHYFGAAYADFVIGDFMTEAVFPSLLHQDPRYFRRGTGGGWSRLGYAMGQIFWTHTDTGRGAFNYSEIAGTAMGVAISNAYYPENGNTSSAISRLSMQIGVDMASNILKEFSPDLSRKFSRMRHHRPR